MVIGIPTDTVYGLACADDNERARQRIYEMKGRPPDLQLPVLVAGIEQAEAATADFQPGDVAAAGLVLRSALSAKHVAVEGDGTLEILRVEVPGA